MTYPKVIEELIKIYKRYGFNVARITANNDVIVFTLKTGYFDNAEIIKLSSSSNTDELLHEFSSSGFACTVREAKSPKEAETELFNGFFSVESTRKKLEEEYNKFKESLVKHYGSTATYTYINAPYHINGEQGEKNPPLEIISRSKENKAILFLIEAAAGFGKTCTAQEIAQLLNTQTECLPLYAELSRNRQARIFRYILLDEIDRTFPLLSSSLVQTEIKNGKITVILDGFDELLRKTEDGDEFNNKEPMLETVSELLVGNAKIIITTRRTILFDGDEFHQWLEKHSNDFSVVRIRIQEPRIKDWLPSERIKRLESIGLDIGAMANPVLLSYLRCIDEDDFAKATENPEFIVQSYFNYLLDREKERQDLRMTVEDQNLVLKNIAFDMIANGYTAENRDYIVKTIIEKCSSQIERTRAQYPATDRPNREEIANKLASHALLDRSSTESTKIGFVNEFSLGNYISECIISDADWLNDDMRFIEPAVQAYFPREKKSKSTLYLGLKSSLPFLDIFNQIDISADLISSLPENLKNDSVDGIELISIDVGDPKIESFQFSNSIFKNCRILKSGLDKVTFLECKFFDCQVIDGESTNIVYILGGHSNTNIHDSFSLPNDNSEYSLKISTGSEINKIILRRFWPTGEAFDKKPSRPIFKPMKHLCIPQEGHSSVTLFNAINSLIKSGILIQKSHSNLITLNLDNISAINELLGDSQ